MSSSAARTDFKDILLPAAYLPPVSYVALCLHSERIRIESLETYPKQTLRNHCIICGPNGRQLLSVPVEKPDGNRTKTRDVRISRLVPWQRHHWRSIETAYSNSPFFLYYQDHFEPIFVKDYEFLTEMTTEILETVLRILKQEKSIEGTTAYEKEVAGSLDLRKRWVKRDSFPGVIFPEYTQVFSFRNGFLPDASILDLIFNLGPESLQYLEELLPRLASGLFPSSTY
jgi:hypothetical protein